MTHPDIRLQRAAAAGETFGRAWARRWPRCFPVFETHFGARSRPSDEAAAWCAGARRGWAAETFLPTIASTMQKTFYATTYIEEIA